MDGPGYGLSGVMGLLRYAKNRFEKPQKNSEKIGENSWAMYLTNSKDKIYTFWKKSVKIVVFMPLVSWLSSRLEADLTVERSQYCFYLSCNGFVNILCVSTNSWNCLEDLDITPGWTRLEGNVIIDIITTIYVNVLTCFDCIDTLRRLTKWFPFEIASNLICLYDPLSVLKFYWDLS